MKVSEDRAEEESRWRDLTVDDDLEWEEGDQILTEKIMAFTEGTNPMAHIHSSDGLNAKNCEGPSC